jgi:hypothetical protein
MKHHNSTLESNHIANLMSELTLNFISECPCFVFSEVNIGKKEIIEELALKRE